MKQPHGAVGRFECDADMRNRKACMVGDDTNDIAVFKFGHRAFNLSFRNDVKGASLRRASTALMFAKVLLSRSNG